jgi:6-pyruvoyltetrahydropterin/6-carboxytetrahydropterin synthase
MKLVKKFKFDSAHYLPDYDGKCSRLHGHCWKLEVEIEGPVQENGMIMDFSLLKKIVDTKIIDLLDHYTVNDIIKVPTAENIIEWIRLQLYDLHPFTTNGVLLTRLRLHETEDSYIEWVLP